MTETPDNLIKRAKNQYTRKHERKYEEDKDYDYVLADGASAAILTCATYLMWLS